MTLFTTAELIDITIVTLAVGFIFSSFLGRYRRYENYDPLKGYSRKFDFSSLLFAIYATAPAIILHELAHKFAALYYGLNADFHAAYSWLGFGVLLKLLNFPFIFFVPGYVSISGSASPLVFAMTAFSGPFLNLMLWILATIFFKKNIFKRHKNILLLTARINMFLFIFNMLPIPGFDGSKVLAGLAKMTGLV